MLDCEVVSLSKCSPGGDVDPSATARGILSRAGLTLSSALPSVDSANETTLSRQTWGLMQGTVDISLTRRGQLHPRLVTFEA